MSILDSSLSAFSVIQKWVIVILLVLVVALSITVYIQHSSNVSLEEKLGSQAELLTQANTDIALSNSQVDALKKQSDDITEAAAILVRKAQSEASSYMNKSDKVLQRPQSGTACNSANDLLNEVISQ